MVSTCCLYAKAGNVLPVPIPLDLQGVPLFTDENAKTLAAHFSDFKTFHRSPIIAPASSLGSGSPPVTFDEIVWRFRVVGCLDMSAGACTLDVYVNVPLVGWTKMGGCHLGFGGGQACTLGFTYASVSLSLEGSVVSTQLVLRGTIGPIAKNIPVLHVNAFSADLAGSVYVDAKAGAIGRAAALLGSQDDTTTVKVWRRPTSDSPLCFPELDDPDFAVPGLTDKAPVAVCISGGGFRATSLALGWLRGLHELGLLDKVRYLSVISGSSWIGAALCFQPEGQVGTFLGPYLPPEQCSIQGLVAEADRVGSYAQAVALAKPVPQLIQCALTELCEGLLEETEAPGLTRDVQREERIRVARFWSTTMAQCFLDPFGLGEVNSSTVRVPGTQVAARVTERAGRVGRGTCIYDANVKEAPFLIMGNTLLLPDADIKFYPLEWTPLYGGCPSLHPDVDPKLGAGWVETLGVNAELVSINPNEAKATALLPAAKSSATPTTTTAMTVEVTAGAGTAAVDASIGATAGMEELEATVRPLGPGSLGEAMGISSSAASTFITNKLPQFEELPYPVRHLLERALGFNVAKVFDMQDWETQDVLLTDGGAHDLYGIYPALRRRLPKMMVLICNDDRLVTESTEEPVTPKAEEQQQEDAPTQPELKGFDAFCARLKDAAGLYGCATDDKDSSQYDKQYNDTHCVFEFDEEPVEAFRKLYEALKANVDAGLAPIYVQTYKIKDNKFLGIQGGWETDVMWVINERVKDSQWERALAPDTKAQLPAAGARPNHHDGMPHRASLAEFPYVSTLSMDYSPELVGLMSNHAAWMLISNKQLLLQKMFS